jgi:hypothetical protein
MDGMALLDEPQDLGVVLTPEAGGRSCMLVQQVPLASGDAACRTLNPSVENAKRSAAKRTFRQIADQVIADATGAAIASSSTAARASAHMRRVPPR